MILARPSLNYRFGFFFVLFELLVNLSLFSPRAIDRMKIKRVFLLETPMARVEFGTIRYSLPSRPSLILD